MGDIDNKCNIRRDDTKMDPTPPPVTPLISSYNDRIRPLLDAVDRLRHLNIMKEGISLPTIVVVGDQSSGKSSVLESLAGISLPRGQGICTRVPLIMRLQGHPDPTPQLTLEYLDKIVPTTEELVSAAIDAATQEIAGDGKSISNSPLTLFVKKRGVPDLTMVDLPGITRVPVHGQPEDIYEQISNIIMEYITPEESIILNVLSATVDFPTCESIRMSQRVDKSGRRTLAVVTKADKAPEGLLEKVTADDVNIGLGYVCVRNRIGDESYEEARKEEEKLFKSNRLLSKIDKTMVGVPTLAQKLVHVQAVIIGRCLPEIVRKINVRLDQNLADLNSIPPCLTTVAEATTAFMRIVGDTKESLRKILFRGQFEEFPDDKKMHCTARLAEMINEYSAELQAKHYNKGYISPDEKFLMEEISILEEAKGLWLPNFLPHAAFLSLLRRKVGEVAEIPMELVRRVCTYLETVVVHVLVRHSENYSQLQSSMTRAARDLVPRMRERLFENVKELIEKEKLVDYTSNPEYQSSWTTLMEQRDHFMGTVDDHGNNSVDLRAFGKVGIEHLTQLRPILDQAFDIKMRLTAYWKIVILRIVDNTAYDILFIVDKLVERELEEEVGKVVLGPGMEGIKRMLEESPSTAIRRARLENSVALLRESKEVVAKAMDGIATVGDFLE